MSSNTGSSVVPRRPLFTIFFLYSIENEYAITEPCRNFDIIKTPVNVKKSYLIVMNSKNNTNQINN